MLLGILSMVAFNLVDTIYVGQLEKENLAALSYTFPVISVIFNLVQGIGIGATALIARSMGGNNIEKARRETTDSVVLGLMVAITASLIGFATIDPLFKAMGAEDQVLELIHDYMDIWYVTIVFVVIPFIGNSAIRATGDTLTPALIMIFAVVINAILDPLLIFGIGPFPEMGLSGAALATSISRAITLFVSFYVLIFREKLLTVHIPSFQVLKGCWLAILKIGVPSGISRMLVPLSLGVVTAIISTIDQDSVAAFGVATRIEFVSMSVLFALAASYGPFSGQNIGAQRIDRVLEAVKKGSLFSLAWSFFFAVVLFFSGKYVAMLFNDHESVINKIALYLSIVPLSYGFQGISQIVNAVLNTANKPLQASLLIVVTMFGLLIPLAKLGSVMYGLTGIFTALAIAYSIGGILSYWLVMKWVGRLHRAESK